MDIEKIVGTTEAAYLLNISVSRLRILLQQDRVKGATKEGRFWRIPLFNGLPRIKERGKGLRGTWRKRTRKDDSMTLIHVNSNRIQSNGKNETYEPVITIRQGSRKNYCHMAQIKGECRIVYRPDDELDCGAKVWIEVIPETVVIPELFNRIKIPIA